MSSARFEMKEGDELGRKKIKISRITSQKSRQVTFNKRKVGLMKKAMELSILCDCEIAVILFDSQHQLYQYSTRNTPAGMEQLIQRWKEYDGNYEALTNSDLQTLKPGRAASFKVSKKRKNANGKAAAAGGSGRRPSQGAAGAGAGAGGDDDDDDEEEDEDAEDDDAEASPTTDDATHTPAAASSGGGGGTYKHTSSHPLHSPGMSLGGSSQHHIAAALANTTHPMLTPLSTGPHSFGGLMSPPALPSGNSLNGGVGGGAFSSQYGHLPGMSVPSSGGASPPGSTLQQVLSSQASLISPTSQGAANMNPVHLAQLQQQLQQQQAVLAQQGRMEQQQQQQQQSHLAAMAAQQQHHPSYMDASLYGSMMQGKGLMSGPNSAISTLGSPYASMMGAGAPATAGGGGGLRVGSGGGSGNGNSPPSTASMMAAQHAHAQAQAAQGGPLSAQAGQAQPYSLGSPHQMYGGANSYNAYMQQSQQAHLHQLQAQIAQQHHQQQQYTAALESVAAAAAAASAASSGAMAEQSSSSNNAAQAAVTSAALSSDAAATAAGSPNGSTGSPTASGSASASASGVAQAAAASSPSSSPPAVVSTSAAASPPTATPSPTPVNSSSSSSLLSKRAPFKQPLSLEIPSKGDGGVGLAGGVDVTNAPPAVEPIGGPPLTAPQASQQSQTQTTSAAQPHVNGTSQRTAPADSTGVKQEGTPQHTQLSAASSSAQQQSGASLGASTNTQMPVSAPVHSSMDLSQMLAQQQHHHQQQHPPPQHAPHPHPHPHPHPYPASAYGMMGSGMTFSPLTSPSSYGMPPEHAGQAAMLFGLQGGMSSMQMHHPASAAAAAAMQHQQQQHHMQSTQASMHALQAQMQQAQQVAAASGHAGGQAPHMMPPTGPLSPYGQWGASYSSAMDNGAKLYSPTALRSPAAAAALFARNPFAQ